MSGRERLRIEGAAIVTADPDLGTIPSGDILVGDGRILEVGERIRAADARTIDGSGWIVSPGFVDTHRHSWLGTARHSYGDVDPLRYFAEVLGGAGPRYSPEDVHAATLLSAVSALSAGTTTLMDWAHIQNSPEHADAGLDALELSGIRAVYGHGWPMTPGGAWTEASMLPHPEDIRRLAARLPSRPSGASSDAEDGRITLALAARGPEMAEPEVWEHELRLARELGLRISVHVGAYARNASVRAVARYAERGLLGPDMTFVHCSHTGADELALIAAAGATVSLGVHCELNSQGIGDIPLDRLLELGIRPSLSGDNETKCSGDMFTQMRALFAYYRSWVGGGHSPVAEPYPLRLQDVHEFATIEGARALGLDRTTGSISPGKQADLVCVRADDLNLAPVSNPLAALVLGAHEGNVDTVLVGGRIVKRGGRMVGVDEPALVARARESQRRLYPLRPGQIG